MHGHARVQHVQWWLYRSSSALDLNVHDRPEANVTTEKDGLVHADGASCRMRHRYERKSDITEGVCINHRRSRCIAPFAGYVPKGTPIALRPLLRFAHLTRCSTLPLSASVCTFIPRGRGEGEHRKRKQQNVGTDLPGLWSLRRR